jgi:ATP-dependent DNA helicase RecQ
VRASARLIREWHPQPTPTWITNVPSLRQPGLVEGFARALARALGLQYRAALEKHADVPEQKHLLNDILQCTNARDSFRADRSRVLLASPVLLVDDTVDSRWTLTVCAALLREAGSGPVIPFALAAAIGTARP